MYPSKRSTFYRKVKEETRSELADVKREWEAFHALSFGDGVMNSGDVAVEVPLSGDGGSGDGTDEENTAASVSGFSHAEHAEVSFGDGSVSDGCMSNVHSSFGECNAGDDAANRVMGMPPSTNEVCQKVRAWAVSNNVPKVFLRGLLPIFRTIMPDFPTHPDTLLGNKRVTNIVKMGNGQYFYFGLSNLLQQVVHRCKYLENVYITVNVDGLPLYKSSGVECWPILFLVDGACMPPLMCSVWCGSGKPPLELFLSDFVAEAKRLSHSGFVADGRRLPFAISKFVCDAPATAYIKNVNGHTSYRGCGKCTQVGSYVQRRMVFPKLKSPLRSDESFASRSDPDHHNGESPLECLPGFGMVSQFPLDYLHLVCLGVTRRLLMWLLHGCKHVRRKVVSTTSLVQINYALVQQGRRWPRGFSRRPRTLDEVKRWKAVEFRQFILYLAPCLLKPHLPVEHYSMLLHLHVGMKLLSSPDVNEECIEVARDCMEKFVRDSRRLLGKEFVTYNVHNLLHLPDDCRRFGNVDNFSAFPFENELQVVKRTVRGGHKPLHQIVGRFMERMRENFVREMQEVQSGVGARLTGKKAKKLHVGTRVHSLLRGDNALFLRDGTVVLAKEFEDVGGGFVIGKAFMNHTDAYDIPLLRSSDLGVCAVSKLGRHSRRWPLNAVECGALLVEYLGIPGQYMAFPLK